MLTKYTKDRRLEPLQLLERPSQSSPQPKKSENLKKNCLTFAPSNAVVVWTKITTGRWVPLRPDPLPATSTRPPCPISGICRKPKTQPFTPRLTRFEARSQRETGPRFIQRALQMTLEKSDGGNGMNESESESPNGRSFPRAPLYPASAKSPHRPRHRRQGSSPGSPSHASCEASG